MKDHKGARRLYRLISKASRSKEVVVGYGKNVTQKKKEEKKTEQQPTWVRCGYAVNREYAIA